MNNIDAIIEAVSKKLNISPEKLRQALKTGDMSSALTNMPKKDLDKLNSVLNDPGLMDAVMKSKQAQELKKQMGKG